MVEVDTESNWNTVQSYNDNKVTLLVKDPHCLFAYWEISEESRLRFLQDFGQQLWEQSKPALKVTNVSKNMSFTIPVDEHANNWYINVEDAESLFIAEIGRLVSSHFFINLAASNYAVTPSSSVSTNTAAYFVNYKSLRNGVLDLESGNIYESFYLNTRSRITLGPSSPEFINRENEEFRFGISSAELFGMGISGYPGVSSESFIR